MSTHKRGNSMIKFLVDAKSVNESNIFLRKLWCELNEIREIGWQYIPYREQNHVHIGISNFGEIYFDYSQTGCIKNIYINNKNEHDKSLIETALANAKNNSLKNYTIHITLSEKHNTQINNISQNDISFSNTENCSILRICTKAYSVWDLEETIKIKLSSILSILYEYTLLFFEIKKIEYEDKLIAPIKFAIKKYDYSWIDFDCSPKSENGEIILPPECLKLLSYIINDDYSDINIAYFVNSCRLLLNCAYNTNLKTNPYMVAGFSEAINSLIVSTFEPLSCILNNSVERCEYCGNLKYSIVSKIKNLVSKYFSNDFARQFCNCYYSSRSSYFHEGKISSLMIPGRISYPQLNPISPKEMLTPHISVSDHYLIELSSYIFRNLAHDYFSDYI